MKRSIILPLAVLVVSGCGGPAVQPNSDGPQIQAIPQASLIPQGATGEPESVRLAAERKVRRSEFHADQARNLFAAGDMIGAEDECLQANRELDMPGDRIAADLAHLLGKTYMARGRYADAVRVMRPNVQRDIALQRIDLALCLLKVGESSEAMELYDPSVLFSRMTAFAPTKDFAPDVRTTAGLEAALKWSKGVALSDVGRGDEAAANYAEAARSLPRNPALALSLGLEQQNLRRFSEAARSFEVVQTNGNETMRSRTRTLYEGAKQLAELKSAVRP